jgi:hypothetical protein
MLSSGEGLVARAGMDTTSSESKSSRWVLDGATETASPAPRSIGPSTRSTPGNDASEILFRYVEMSRRRPATYRTARWTSPVPWVASGRESVRMDARSCTYHLSPYDSISKPR